MGRRYAVHDELNNETFYYEDGREVFDPEELAGWNDEFKEPEFDTEEED